MPHIKGLDEQKKAMKQIASMLSTLSKLNSFDKSTFLSGEFQLSLITVNKTDALTTSGSISSKKMARSFGMIVQESKKNLVDEVTRLASEHRIELDNADKQILNGSIGEENEDEDTPMQEESNSSPAL